MIIICLWWRKTGLIGSSHHFYISPLSHYLGHKSRFVLYENILSAPASRIIINAETFPAAPRCLIKVVLVPIFRGSNYSSPPPPLYSLTMVFFSRNRFSVLPTLLLPVLRCCISIPGVGGSVYGRHEESRARSRLLIHFSQRGERENFTLNSTHSLSFDYGPSGGWKGIVNPAAACFYFCTYFRMLQAPGFYAEPIRYSGRTGFFLQLVLSIWLRGVDPWTKNHFGRTLNLAVGWWWFTGRIGSGFERMDLWRIVLLKKIFFLDNYVEIW